MLKSGLLGLIGHTPLIRAERLSERLGRDILLKMEALMPGGSVKDRTALALVLDAEERGALPRAPAGGGLIVEGTAGNTGIGFALVARARGHRALIVMPDNQSPEKYDVLRALGAELMTVPAVPFANQNHFYHTAKRVAAERNGCWMDQFENPANWRTHFATTGPEIWGQSEQRLDAFVMSAGTGGTIGGVTKFLKSQRAEIRTVLADPFGSGLFEFVKNGVIKSEGSSITEGIGIMRLTENFKQAVLDDAVRVADQDLVRQAHQLLADEGLWIGSSSALNVAAAVEVAKALPAGARVATVVCDGGNRYAQRLFNPEWLSNKGLTAT